MHSGSPHCFGAVAGGSPCPAETGKRPVLATQERNLGALPARAKAQQTLHKDIADCVTEIDELERLGPLREAIPADTQNGQVPDPNSADGKLRRWYTPKRDGHLYSEHFNYVDFEGCMDYKGWERLEAMPYDRAKIARDDYMENVYDYKAHSNYPDVTPKSADAYTSSSPGTVVNN